MAKLENMFLILHLLHKQERVSRDQIAKICNISNRTVFRYIQTIANANIPIAYERETGSFYLDDNAAFNLPERSPNELLLMLLALNMLSKKMNTEYTNSITSLIKGISAQLMIKNENLFELLDEAVDTIVEDRNPSEIVTSLLIRTAISSNSRLRVSARNKTGKMRAVKIDNPRLIYRDRWTILEKRTKDEKSIPLQDIVRAEIV